MSARGMTCYAVRVVVQMPGHPSTPLAMMISRRTAREAERVAEHIALQIYRDAACVASAVADHDSVIHTTRSDLMPDDIRAIRASTGTQREIGRRYNVPPRMVADIRAGRTWTSIP